MTIGKSQIELEHGLRWNLTTGAHALDQRIADKIASALATAISRNNDCIEQQLLALFAPSIGIATESGSLENNARAKQEENEQKAQHL